MTAGESMGPTVLRLRRDCAHHQRVANPIFRGVGWCSCQPGRVERDVWDNHPIFGRDQPSDPDKWIFHYTTVGRLAEISVVGALVLSPLERLNDPRESKPRQIITMVSGVPGPSFRSISVDERRAVEEILDRRRLNVRVCCFTRDAAEGDPGTAKRANGRGFARPALWAHYADRHAGVCLVFDRAALEQQAIDSFGDRALSIRLHYQEGFDDAVAAADMVNFDHLDVDSHFRNRVIATLGRKNADWAVERECRIAVIDEPKQTCLLSVEGAFAGLVLGLDLSPSHLCLAEAVCARFGLGGNVGLAFGENAVLDVVPARSSDGALVKWSETEIRAGDMFDR